MENVGFIGLGIMGMGMARNLAKAGYAVVVWNRTASKAEDFAASLATLSPDDDVKGSVTVAESPAAVGAACEIVVICVSDTPDVIEVVRGGETVEHGLLESLRNDAVVVDCSTISAATTRELAEQVSEKGGWWLDAPVSGGSEGAAKGQLAVMVGGDADAMERVRPVLETFSKSIVHVGPSGAGQLCKSVNQILVAGTMLSMAEAFLLASAEGLDLEKVLEAVSGGAAGSWTLSNRGPQAIERDWRPGFTIDLQTKDLRLVLEAADRLGVPMPGTAIATDLYRSLIKQGDGGLGNHAIVRALERLCGIEVGKCMDS